MHWIKQLELFHTKNYTYHNSTCLQTPLYRKMTCPNRLSELATNFEPLLTCAPSIDLDPNRTIQFVLINGLHYAWVRGPVSNLRQRLTTRTRGVHRGVDWFAVASLSNEVRRWHVSGNPLGRF